MRVYNDFFLVPGSRSMFPDTDPDPDPTRPNDTDPTGSETLLKAM